MSGTGNQGGSRNLLLGVDGGSGRSNIIFLANIIFHIKLVHGDVAKLIRALEVGKSHYILDKNYG